MEFEGAPKKTNRLIFIIKKAPKFPRIPFWFLYFFCDVVLENYKELKLIHL
jgi:hypothetical protein